MSPLRRPRDTCVTQQQITVGNDVFYAVRTVTSLEFSELEDTRQPVRA
jgi:hypothetical protein